MLWRSNLSAAVPSFTLGAMRIAACLKGSLNLPRKPELERQSAQSQGDGMVTNWLLAEIESNAGRYFTLKRRRLRQVLAAGQAATVPYEPGPIRMGGLAHGDARTTEHRGNHAMKATILVLLAGALLGATCPAFADCASELTVHAIEPQQPLPPACRAMGPLYLGMTRAAMLAVMGRPDNANVPEPESDMSVVYVFPRDLRARLRAHPMHRAAFDSLMAFIVVTLHDGKVAMIHAFDDGAPPSIPYTVGGIALHENITELLDVVGAIPLWGDTKDYVALRPYPIGIEVDTDSNRVMGISIAVNDHISGDWPAFQWIIDPATGLVGGYRVFFRDFPRRQRVTQAQ